MSNIKLIRNDFGQLSAPTFVQFLALKFDGVINWQTSITKATALDLIPEYLAEVQVALEQMVGEWEDDIN